MDELRAEQSELLRRGDRSDDEPRRLQQGLDDLESGAGEASSFRRSLDDGLPSVV